MSITTVIARGAPGFGKSTYCNKVLATVMGIDVLTAPNDVLVLSTDDFFMEDGNYNWVAEKMGEAHQWNRERALKAYVFNKPLIVVIDNTNINVEEMAFYWGLGSIFGPVEIHQLDLSDVDLAKARNVHNVPSNIIERMASRLAGPHCKVPRYWGCATRTVKPVDGAFIVDGERIEIPAEPVEELEPASEEESDGGEN